MRDMLLILNFDNPATRAIAHSLRAEHIDCRIVPPNISLSEVRSLSPLGLILCGGAGGSIPTGLDGQIPGSGLPLLALGNAAAMLCRLLHGDVRETVLCNSIDTVRFSPSPLTEGLDTCERMLPNVRRLRLPAEAETIAEAENEAVGFCIPARSLYALQFALESNDTDGMQLLLNFAQNICGCTPWWNAEAFIAEASSEISNAVRDGRAVCTMTGGLNSGICALLAQKALGNSLECIFIDTGLMRKNEVSRFLSLYRDKMNLQITCVNAEERFLAALQGIVSPDEKKQIIGTLLQQILDETYASMGEFSAVIRSTTSNDVLRETNTTARPGIRADLPVLEPLRELFKDEVRPIGEYLGIPSEMLTQQSFPGSGLALRIQGDVTPARLQTLRAADEIFTDELRQAGLSKRLNRYFAMLGALPGDDTHTVIILRAVHSGDYMQSASAARLPFDLLERVNDRILRERPEVSHVVYDLSATSPRSGAEWQ